MSLPMRRPGCPPCVGEEVTCYRHTDLGVAICSSPSLVVLFKVSKCSLLPFMPPWTHRLVVGGGDTARADTNPICVAARAVANESKSDTIYLALRYCLLCSHLCRYSLYFLHPSDLVDPQHSTS
jgi:hypothetical protein